MKYFCKKSILGTAVAASLLGLCGTAQADAYSVAINRFDNFRLIGSEGQQTLSLGSAKRTTTGLTIYEGSAPGVGYAVTANPPGLTTYPLLCSGPSCPVGPLGTIAPTLGAVPAIGLALDPADYVRAAPAAAEYSRADAYSAGDILGNGVTVRTLTETNRTLTGAAAADAVVALTGDVLLTLTVPETLTFEFYGSRDLGVSTTQLGEVANASINDVFNIQCLSDESPLCANSSRILFQFSPDGAAGGNINGMAEIDPFSLNTTIGSTDVQTPVNLVNGPALFSLTSSFLFPAGTYVLNLNKDTHADVLAVPEPASLALLSMGLLGLGASRRRKSGR